MEIGKILQLIFSSILLTIAVFFVAGKIWAAIVAFLMMIMIGFLIWWKKRQYYAEDEDIFGEVSDKADFQISMRNQKMLFYIFLLILFIAGFVVIYLRLSPSDDPSNLTATIADPAIMIGTIFYLGWAAVNQRKMSLGITAGIVFIATIIQLIFHNNGIQVTGYFAALTMPILLITLAIFLFFASKLDRFWKMRTLNSPAMIMIVILAIFIPKNFIHQTYDMTFTLPMKNPPAQFVKNDEQFYDIPYLQPAWNAKLWSKYDEKQPKIGQKIDVVKFDKMKMATLTEISKDKNTIYTANFMQNYAIYATEKLTTVTDIISQLGIQTVYTNSSGNSDYFTFKSDQAKKLIYQILLSAQQPMKSMKIVPEKEIHLMSADGNYELIFYLHKNTLCVRNSDETYQGWQISDDFAKLLNAQN